MTNGVIAWMVSSVVIILGFVLYVLIDRRGLLRSAKVIGLSVALLALMGCLVWLGGANKYISETVIVILGIVWPLLALKGKWDVLTILVPVAVSVLVGVSCCGYFLDFMCSEYHLMHWHKAGYVPMVILTALFSLVIIKALHAYRQNLNNTEAHRQYLTANGASRVESVLPSVRKAMRAAIHPMLKILVNPFVIAFAVVLAVMGSTDVADRMIQVFVMLFGLILGIFVAQVFVAALVLVLTEVFTFILASVRKP